MKPIGKTAGNRSAFILIFPVLFAAARVWAGETSSQSNPQTFVNSLGMKMIMVKADVFDAWTPSIARYGEMSSSGTPPDVAFALNRPHVLIRVELEDDYYLSAFPVTNSMYRQFVEETHHAVPQGEMVSFFWSTRSGATWELDDFKGADHPVVAVNDVDAMAFLEWLTQKEGRSYRLPTIYEFEYAARAGTHTPFWWGDHPDVRHMNYGVSGLGHPMPVGSYPPNPWGFYDMHGNVWEACSDGSRFLAKGSAFNSPQHLTGADAFSSFKYGDLRLLSTGFRLACAGGDGFKRSNDLDEPMNLPARPEGPTFPELEITVGQRIDLGALATNCANFLVTRDGTWILNNRRSTDQGESWQPSTVITEADAYGQLRDGSIMVVRGDPVTFNNPMEGKGQVTVFVSNDEWQTVESFHAPIHVPMGHIFCTVRGLTELEDGRILMTMYGNMEGDRVWTASPVAAELIHKNNWFKNRVIVVESTDRGKSWRFVSTVSYHPELTPMGTNESDISVLPDGRLLTAMRSGVHGYTDLHGRNHLDQPLLLA